MPSFIHLLSSQRPTQTTPSSLAPFLQSLSAGSEGFLDSLKHALKQQEDQGPAHTDQHADVLQQLVSEGFASKLLAFVESLEWAASHTSSASAKAALQNLLRSLIHLLRPPAEYSVEEIYGAGAASPPLAHSSQQQEQQQTQLAGAKGHTEAHALAAQALAAELVCSSVLKRLSSLAFNQLAVETEDYGPGILLHEVATELLDALVDEPGGCATSDKTPPHIVQNLLSAAGGAEQAHVLMQCVRAVETDFTGERMQQGSDSSEPATAAVLSAMAGGLQSKGYAALETLLHMQPSLVLLRLCSRAYTCLHQQYV